jgi:hypothetical protein
MPSEVDEFWHYIMRAPKGRHHGAFALYSAKTGRFVTFNLWPRKEARPARPGLKDPSDREGRLAGVGVFASLGNRLAGQNSSWVYLGAIERGTHELKIAGERSLCLVPRPTRGELVRTLQWLVARLKDENWPPNGVEVWHLGICRECYQRCCDADRAPPYPECIACREKRLEQEPRTRAPIRDDIDDELPANVHRFRRDE